MFKKFGVESCCRADKEQAICSDLHQHNKLISFVSFCKKYKTALNFVFVFAMFMISLFRVTFGVDEGFEVVA